MAPVIRNPSHNDKAFPMTNYTDFFILPVPRANLDAYRKQAELFATVWKDHGALSCVEFEADDVPTGKVTSFPQAVHLKPDETVMVGAISYKSRAHRDEVNAKAMKDERMAAMDPQSMTFDGKRMFFGGFQHFIGN